MRAPVPFLALVALLILPSTGHAANDEWLIVPGRSVGKITIGMDQRDLFALLGTPAMQNDFEMTDRHAVYYERGRQGDVPVAQGVTQSDWITPVPLPKNLEDYHEYLSDFVTAYVRDTKVVQIEIRVGRFHTADGLSVRNTGIDWRKRYPQTERFDCKYLHPSKGGIPGAKHIMTYEDAVGDGVGWRCAGFTDLAADTDSDGVLDTVIVHAPGQKLIADPDGGSRFIWKDRPGRKAGVNGD